MGGINGGKNSECKNGLDTCRKTECEIFWEFIEKHVQLEQIIHTVRWEGYEEAENHLKGHQTVNHERFNQRPVKTNSKKAKKVIFVSKETHT